MTAPAVQLALPGIDALADDLTEAERIAHEAAAEHQDAHRADFALSARPCRCGPRAWGDAAERQCQRCGRSVA